MKTFKEYAPGFVHVDMKHLPQLPDADQRTYLFAAIDRATRLVYVEVLKDKSATTASGFLKAPDRQRAIHHQQSPHRQWQGIYRPLLRHRRAPADRHPCLPIGSAPTTALSTA